MEIFENSTESSKKLRGYFSMKLNKIGWEYVGYGCLDVRFGLNDYKIGKMMMEIIFVIDYYEN
jgi:hypothetical protein